MQSHQLLRTRHDKANCANHSANQEGQADLSSFLFFLYIFVVLQQRGESGNYDTMMYPILPLQVYSTATYSLLPGPGTSCLLVLVLARDLQLVVTPGPRETS
jgi:hypothetical protein